MTEKKRVVFATGLIALLGGVLFFAGNSEERPRALGNGSGDWEEIIRSLGGSEAYARFAEEVEPLSAAERHTKAHEFGSGLYAAEGLLGLGTCDDRFSYGCFHEFMGRAIAERGLGIVLELNEGCIAALVKSPVSCQHGIGHGIQAYFGYDESALRQSLDECFRIPYNDPIGGCYGGVFMEYNMQTMLGTDARLRLPQKDEDMYEPCRSLPEEYAASCMFWQPQWWHVAAFLGASTTEVFARMGGYCHGMANGDPALSRSCFEGIGNVVTAAALFDTMRSAELCDSTSGNSIERLYCRSLAANSLSVGGSGMEGPGEKICHGLEGEYLSFCLAYARNQANILEVLPVPHQ